METENERPHGEVEEVQPTITPKEETLQDDVVTLPKSEFNTYKRKAFAYDAGKKQPQTPKEVDPELGSRLSKLEQVETKRTFGFENQLSPEETDFVFRLSGGKPDKTVLEDPFVKSGLEGYRQSKRASDNTPGTTTRGFASSGKEFKDLTEQERRQAFENDPRLKK